MNYLEMEGFITRAVIPTERHQSRFGRMASSLHAVLRRLFIRI